ncbi:MAG TPA: DUF1569 domain-containing protein [Flavobacteriaceae bacterium]|nr:DUF1569 domain-containing protein [Flavobacteriaceae bacterium]HIP26170.1 DUF1569 domain-containing protein [Flavobacteriaceae bacterium]
MKNIFDKEIAREVIERINTLNSNTKASWGKMNVSQMLAHLNVQYEIVYENDKFPKPNFIVDFILKTFVKKKVVSSKPFPKNGKTAPYFVISSQKDFDKEKERLIKYISITQANGIDILLPRKTKSFGKLTAQEWNNLFYKHLDHHLTQFGV